MGPKAVCGVMERTHRSDWCAWMPVTYFLDHGPADAPATVTRQDEDFMDHHHAILLATSETAQTTVYKK